MILLKRCFPALSCVLTLALSSCLDTHEEIWIDAYGGGRARVAYSLPAAAARINGGDEGIRTIIGGFLRDNPDISSSSFDVVTEGSRTRIAIEVAFDSALDIIDLTSSESVGTLPSSATHLAGEAKVELHGRTIDFQRTATPADALPGSMFFPASRTDGHRMITIIHLPAAAISSNATSVENGGRTLIWDTPLTQALKAPVSNRFKMDLPIPWKAITTVALPLTLACGFVLLRIRKSRQLRKTPA